MTNTPTAHGVLEDPVAEIVVVSDFLKENADAVTSNEDLAVAVVGLGQVIYEKYETSLRISDTVVSRSRISVVSRSRAAAVSRSRATAVRQKQDAVMAAARATAAKRTRAAGVAAAIAAEARPVQNAAATVALATAQTVGRLVSAANPLEAARRARARRELGALDYIRAVRSAAEAGVGQREIGRALGIAQPSVSRLLTQAEARGVQPIPEGFSGASPYEVAERYAAGDIGRDTLIRELSVWPYVKNEGAAAAQAEWDSTPYPDTPGSFAEVGKAFDDGLIDAEAYDLILDAPDDVPATS